MNRADIDTALEFDPRYGAAPVSEIAAPAYINGLARRLQRDRDEARQLRQDTADLVARFDRFDRRLVVARLDALLAVRAADAGLALINAGAR